MFRATHMIDLLQTEIRNWRARERDRNSGSLSENRCWNFPWRSLFPKSSFSFFFFFFFFSGSTGLWLAPRAVRSHAAVCVLRLHVLKLLNVQLASSFLAFPWSLGHLSFPPCERSSQWTEQTDRLNYVLVRSQGRGLYRALDSWASCLRRSRGHYARVLREIYVEPRPRPRLLTDLEFSSAVLRSIFQVQGRPWARHSTGSPRKSTPPHKSEKLAKTCTSVATSAEQAEIFRVVREGHPIPESTCWTSPIVMQLVEKRPLWSNGKSMCFYGNSSPRKEKTERCPKLSPTLPFSLPVLLHVWQHAFLALGEEFQGRNNRSS